MIRLAPCRGLEDSRCEGGIVRHLEEVRRADRVSRVLVRACGEGGLPELLVESRRPTKVSVRFELLRRSRGRFVPLLEDEAGGLESERIVCRFCGEA
jgi:hypothetical protein